MEPCNTHGHPLPALILHHSAVVQAYMAVVWLAIVVLHFSLINRRYKESGWLLRIGLGVQCCGAVAGLFGLYFLARERGVYLSEIFIWTGTLMVLVQRALQQWWPKSPNSRFGCGRYRKDRRKRGTDCPPTDPTP